MKRLFFFISLITIACASDAKKSSSFDFQSFDTISLLESSVMLEKSYGKPKHAELTTLEGQTFSSWSYYGSQGYPVAEFLIQPETKKIVEKVFYPPKDSSLTTLKNALEVTYKGTSFEKIKVKCRHHGELVLLARAKSIMLVTSDHEGAALTAIVSGTPETINLRLQENEHKTCKNRWEK